jgi:hypothetical protein
MSEHSCDWDKEIGLEWFIECYSDLNEDSRAEIFRKRIFFFSKKLKIKILFKTFVYLVSYR